MAEPINPRVDIGHVHLKVADLDRALAFYTGILGFEVTARMGPSAAFLSAGGYHHHIGLNTWESRNGTPPAAGTTGLYHVAIRYPDRAALGEALYLRDPDENGVELYWDRLPDLWPRTPQGELAMFTRRLDLNGLLKEVEAAKDAPKVGEGPQDL